MKPSWHDGATWSDLRSGSGCPFCTGEGPRDIIASSGDVHVTMPESVAVRGYACVILRRHATELHELTNVEGAAFMNDVQTASRVVHACTGAIKLNYEIHGNVVPHVHLHIIPRYVGDGIETSGRGFAQQTESPYSNGEFAALRGRVQQSLAQLPGWAGVEA
jgi:diadenosine tetraphosphate (Ap4A) HIT family hydrolase